MLKVSVETVVLEYVMVPFSQWLSVGYQIVRVKSVYRVSMFQTITCKHISSLPVLASLARHVPLYFVVE